MGIESDQERIKFLAEVRDKWVKLTMVSLQSPDQEMVEMAYDTAFSVGYQLGRVEAILSGEQHEP